MKLTAEYLRANVIVHVARVWERLKVSQEDNIESVETIVSIADDIMRNPIVNKYLGTDVEEWDWFSETGYHFSDVFFEELAMEKIYQENNIALEYISKEDYIFWDHKADEPLEDLSTVYHYTSIIELLNSDFNLGYDETVIRLIDLPFMWQIKINNAIKNGKKD